MRIIAGYRVLATVYWIPFTGYRVLATAYVKEREVESKITIVLSLQEIERVVNDAKNIIPVGQRKLNSDKRGVVGPNAVLSARTQDASCA